MPATYETVTDRVMIKEGSKRVEIIPAKFETVSEQVLVAPARTEWHAVACEAPKPKCNTCSRCGSRRNADYRPAPVVTAPRLCLVEIPARYETVSHQEMVQPPSERTVEIAPEFREVTKQVVKEPAHTVVVQVPAEYQTVTQQVMIADARSEWQQIDCKSGQQVTRNEVKPEQAIQQPTQVSSLQR